MTRKAGNCFFLFCATQPVCAMAATPSSLFNFGKSGDALSAPVQIVILLTLLTLLPAIIMSITPFLRIAIVLHFLRQALGTQTVPSNQVLLGISLFLTMLIVQPVAADMYQQGWEPLEKNQVSASDAFDAGTRPLKNFLVRFAREKDVKLFLEISHSPAPRKPSDLELRILIPAYILPRRGNLWVMPPVQCGCRRRKR